MCTSVVPSFNAPFSMELAPLIKSPPVPVLVMLTTLVSPATIEGASSTALPVALRFTPFIANEEVILP